MANKKLRKVISWIQTPLSFFDATIPSQSSESTSNNTEYTGSISVYKKLEKKIIQDCNIGKRERKEGRRHLPACSQKEGKDRRTDSFANWKLTLAILPSIIVSSINVAYISNFKDYYGRITNLEREKLQ